VTRRAPASSAGRALEVYVWFEADPSDDAAVQAAVGRLADAMAGGAPGAASRRPRLLRRPDLKQRDGRPRATWMEAWPAVPGHALPDWLATLAAQAQACGAAALARGGRHVEPFPPMAVPRAG
jgi:hypothetical protein